MGNDTLGSNQTGAWSNTVMPVISADLPFAAGRFCTAEGIASVATLSILRGGDLKTHYGRGQRQRPTEGRHCARGVLVFDEGNKALHAEPMPDLKREPNCDAAIAALK